MSVNAVNINFTYMKKTPYEKKALDNITLNIESGEIFGIIGSTGSGKSTFIQHINGLLPLQDGKMEVFDIDLTVKKPNFKKLRSLVGMVFQYPEYQLFENTVEMDVAFGPKNLGLKGEELQKRVELSIKLVGLDFESIKDRSPFELSGGQKRRVAIAGIIAMQPKILILDEPTAGLDPIGKKDILNLILKLKKSIVETVIIISHDMDEISDIADRIAVFHKSQVLYIEKPVNLFNHCEKLRNIGLDIPKVSEIKNKLKEKGIYIPNEILKIDELVAYISAFLVNREHTDKEWEID